MPPEVRISAVANPTLHDALTARIARVFDGMHVYIATSEGTTTGLRSGYRNSTQLGTDRQVGTVGAHHLWPGTTPLFMTTSTATTLDTITPSGLLADDLILPGLTLMVYTLSRSATQSLEVGVGYLNAGDVVASPWADDTQGAVALNCVTAQAGVATQVWQALQK